MNGTAPTIADVLNFVNSFYGQCRNIVLDTVRLLRDNSRIYLVHKKEWDYTRKPGDRFLETEISCIRNAWSTYLPTGEIQRGALFYFEFFHPHRQIGPSLMYGSVNPGNMGFDVVDRWASYYTTHSVDARDGTLAVSHSGPIAVINGKMPKRFEEAMLVRVPLEAICNQQALETMVVAPLAALLRGSQEGALACLQGVPTVQWPSFVSSETEEDEDESEQP